MSTNRSLDKDVVCIYIYIYVYIYIYMYIYIHTVTYYPAMKKNEIMSFAAIWMDLEIIRLSDISQRKTNIVCYCF